MSSKRCVKRRQARARSCVSPELGVYMKNACQGKRSYDTYSQANRAMHELMDKPCYDGSYLETYECPITGNHFHYGHRPEKAHRLKHAFYCTQIA